MKLRWITIVFVSIVTLHAHSQGMFLFSSANARTRLHSIDGPLAGRGIWAHMMAGTNAEALLPVGDSQEHAGSGLVFDGDIAVPGVPGFSYAHVQMVAWDGTLWGTLLSGVPADQLGRTDIVQVELVPNNGPWYPLAPPFTQAAVVPIPEPSVWTLAAVGGALCWLRLRRLDGSLLGASP